MPRTRSGERRARHAAPPPAGPRGWLIVVLLIAAVAAVATVIVWRSAAAPPPARQQNPAGSVAMAKRLADIADAADRVGLEQAAGMVFGTNQPHLIPVLRRMVGETSDPVAGLDVKKPVDPAAWAAVEAAAPDASFLDGVDVRDEARVASAVGAVLESFRRIDVLVNAAGVEGVGAAHELAEESWDRTVDINLKGSYLVAKHVLPSMLARKAGSVIHVASVEGLEGLAGSLAYNASKGGVVLMTKSMALDYGPLGIRVNCLCPGLILTPLTEIVQQAKPVLEQMVSWHALGRAGRPEEVAAAALFLASDDASFVTGHALVVDGGWTAGRRILPA